MKFPSPLRMQQGVTLIVGLIMLVVITLMVISAFSLSVSNLRAVGNMQFRTEAIAAASKAIEQKIGSLCPLPCLTAPTGEGEVLVDLMNGAPEYKVVIATPTCVRRTPVISAAAAGGGSSVTLGLPGGTTYFNTVWDIDASVTDSSSGASVRVHQGIGLLLSQTQCSAVCPPALGVACS